VLIATSEAFTKTFGLLVTFVGIGVIVNVILVYIAVQVRGERRQNEELSSSRRPPGE
jgi:heme/copper-type cytochrome/quinol oxidase subunit 2